jgi:predicted homoserine dehydrogenase-like protein
MRKNVNCKKLLQSTDVTRVGLIGTGAFGRSFLSQSRRNRSIRVAAVCDRNIGIATKACLQASITGDELRVCQTESEANDAVLSGKTAVVSDGLLVIDLPIDVVIEATGIPEVGAVHARSAIQNGKHVVMVSKETDSVVGPVLNRMAEDAGVVYTPADGDQPSLLIGLISWAETLGFEIVCGGKAGELDFVFDPDSRTATRGDRSVNINSADLAKYSGGSYGDLLSARHKALAALPRYIVADLCEMAIVINHTGLAFDAPYLHAPIARINEMPDIFCLRDAGGILHQEGVIDMVNCLRGSEEVSFAGGVFIVVKCRGQETWQLLKDKGHLISRDGTRAMIFRPYHLLGVESATSVLAANHLGISTGGIDFRPRADVGIRATRNLQMGDQLTIMSDHSIWGMEPEIMQAASIVDDNPVPYYLAAGRRLRENLRAGQLLTGSMVDIEKNSVLLELRLEQDRMFTL